VNILFLLLPVALGVVAVAVGAFVWAARRGQFDDLDTPALRVLRDDDPPARAVLPGAPKSTRPE